MSPTKKLMVLGAIMKKKKKTEPEDKGAENGTDATSEGQAGGIGTCRRTE